MNFQFWIMLALTLAATVFMARRMFKSSCASGCGSCKKGCPAKKLEAVRVKVKNS